MDRVPGPQELRGAAAVATSLAYVVGIAGIVAGGLSLRDGDMVAAVVTWVLTFAAGAALMVLAMLVRGVAALLARLAQVEQDVRVLLSDRRREGDGNGGERWGHRPPY